MIQQERNHHSGLERHFWCPFMHTAKFLSLFPAPFPTWSASPRDWGWKSSQTLPGVATSPRTCSLLRTGSRRTGNTPENLGEALCTQCGFPELQQYRWPPRVLTASGTVGQWGSGLVSFFFPQSKFCHTQAPANGFVAESIYKKENIWALQKPPIQMLIAFGLSNTQFINGFSHFLHAVGQWQPVIILTDQSAWKYFHYSEESCISKWVWKHRDICVVPAFSKECRREGRRWEVRKGYWGRISAPLKQQTTLKWKLRGRLKSQLLNALRINVVKYLNFTIKHIFVY